MDNLYIYICICNLSGWWLNPTPLKNVKVTWDDDIPNIWKNKKCSKPPTSSVCSCLMFFVVTVNVIILWKIDIDGI